MTGKVSAGKFHPKHSNLELAELVQQVPAHAQSNVKMHVICDSYDTHRHQNMKCDASVHHTNN